MYIYFLGPKEQHPNGKFENDKYTLNFCYLHMLCFVYGFQ